MRKHAFALSLLASLCAAPASLGAQTPTAEARPEAKVAPAPAAEPAPAEEPAPAQTAPMAEFYGTLLLYADLMNQDQGGTRGRLNAGTSGLGVKGVFESPYGVHAFYQVEMGIALDENGIGPSPSSAFPLRNTGIGLFGKFGKVFFGSWDTPLKTQMLDIGPVRGLHPFNPPMILNPGHGIQVTNTHGGRIGAGNDAGFVRRQGNSIQYWSPNLYGLSLRLGYSTNESQTVIDDARIAPSLYSAALRYEIGGLSLRYAYERHVDYFGLSQLASAAGTPGTPSASNPESTDQAHLLAASWRFGGTRLVALFERLSYDNDDSTVGNLEHYSRYYFLVYGEQSFGPHKFFGQFGRADQGRCEKVGGQACHTKGLGAIAWTAGYAFTLNPHSTVYVAYQQILNEANARYATFPPVGPTLAGENYQSAGLGILVTL